MNLLANYAFKLASVPVDIEVEFRNVKTLRLTVYPPDGRVKIAAPPGTEAEFVRKFAESKTAFIEKHRERFRNHSKADAALRGGSTAYVWGTPLALELVERRGNPKIAIEGGRMTVFVRPDSPAAKRREFLDAWYRRNLQEAAPPIVKKWEAALGVEVKKLYFRKMKSHWGSCNREKRTIRLNSELAKRSPECLEYVIVHEMIHIIESGHNRNFYRILNQFLPGWKTIRKKMNSGEL